MPELTHHERRTLDLIRLDKNEFEIATALACRPHTVRGTAATLGQKLRAASWQALKAVRA